ncbi:MAG: polysaccharide export protein [Magnetococcales bacterium]|nr:polysaccharide export protein [Magnetococcales bacterium]MBF0157420.1 polysaccharide export protein [Magnetococcales bacterium]
MTAVAVRHIGEFPAPPLRSILAWLIKLGLLCAISWVLLADPGDGLDNQYRLGPGDKIQIAVNDEPDLTQETKINLNGKISYSFLGEIEVAGLTVKELEEKIHSLLLDGYLRQPVVAVTVVEHRIYFVNGEVSKAGGYPYQPGLTVRKAVVLAGGFNERADPEAVRVIRGSDPLYKEVPIGLDDAVYPGDILTVPESFW